MQAVTNIPQLDDYAVYESTLSTHTNVPDESGRSFFVCNATSETLVINKSTTQSG